VSAITKRQLLDMAITATFYFLLSEVAGAGLWGMLLLPYAAWNFYDGQTRGSLKGKP